MLSVQNLFYQAASLAVQIQKRTVNIKPLSPV